MRRFVVDSNVLISALMKNAKTRELIVKCSSELLITSVALDEIEKYSVDLLRRSQLSKSQFQVLLKELLNRMTIVWTNSFLQPTKPTR